jgi:3-dehydroquinate synthase
MTSYSVKSSQGSYPVLLESGSRRELASWLPRIAPDSRFLVISDENVSLIYRDNIESYLESHNISLEWITIKPGEKSKNFDSFKKVISQVIDLELDRGDMIIALGGGVATDLSGFIASIYKRGIRWIALPTSLLAMVDASIGGKTALDYGNIKNVIGTFHAPSLVIIDPEFTLTLPSRELVNGLIEVSKMAILPGGTDFTIWSKQSRDLAMKRDIPVITSMIRDSCNLKIPIVERDEMDHAGRIMLNLGHTLAHALESSGSLKKISHGEAVCMGVLFISKVSNMNDDLPVQDFSKIRQLYENILPRINLTNICWSELRDFINHDKKNKGADSQWVYPLKIGEIAIRTIDNKTLEIAWLKFKDEYREWCRIENSKKR